MCGIFGMQIEDWALSDGRRMLLATNLASLNDARGGHSWGLVKLPGVPNAFVEQEGEEQTESHEMVEVARGLGEVSDYVHQLSKATAFFGHTRFATVGDKTVANAHPFEIGKILGAHNGAVYNHDEMKTKYGRDFAVDSMHIFGHLDSELPMNELEGYGAIVWIERANPKRIYLCKLRGGDLSIWGLGDYKKCISGVVFSSDKAHLKLALNRARITDDEYFMFNVEMGQVYFIENAMFYEYDRKIILNMKSGTTTCNTNSNWRGYQGAWDHDYDGASYGRGKNRKHKDNRFQFGEEKTPTALPPKDETENQVSGIETVGLDSDVEGMTKPNDMLHLSGR